MSVLICILAAISGGGFGFIAGRTFPSTQKDRLVTAAATLVGASLAAIFAIALERIA